MKITGYVVDEPRLHCQCHSDDDGKNTDILPTAEVITDKGKTGAIKSGSSHDKRDRGRANRRKNKDQFHI